MVLDFFDSGTLKNLKEQNGFSAEAEYYEYPSYFGDTEFEAEDYEKMLLVILNEEGRLFRFYFENHENVETSKGMILINKDGSVFLGLSTYRDYLFKYEEALKKDFHSFLILICNEALPPDTLKEF